MPNPNSGIAAIGSSGGPSSPSSVGGASAISRGDRGGADATNKLADTITNSLTGGGKGQFETPGAQQDFKKDMRAAVGDLVEGAKSGNSEQMTKGLTAMIGLLTDLAKGKKADAEEGAGAGKGGAGASKGPGESQGASAPTAGGADGDKKKKLQELIQMLLEMGISPDMISQLLEAMGMPPDEAKQMISQASQAAGGESSEGEGGGAQANANSMKMNALSA